MKYTKIILSTVVVSSIAVFALASPQSNVRSQSVVALDIEMPAGVTSPATVVELFTSQGCSSCPPANGLVRDITGSENLLTLSYSVDYWDYLGWKDTLGKPEFSARQRDYGQHFQGQVYTPQIIVNGATHAARFTKPEIRKHTLESKTTSLTLKKTSEGIEVKGIGRAGSIVAVRYTPGVQSVPVSRGENRGRTIKLANVVNSFTKLGDWDDGDTFTKTVSVPENGEAIAFLVQTSDGGPILTAANYLP